MAGSVAHVLGVGFFDAMRMPLSRLIILHNESERQRALDAERMANAFSGGKPFAEYIENAKTIHGDYTDGFYEGQFNLLKKNLFGK